MFDIIQDIICTIISFSFNNLRLICEINKEDVESQIIFWNELNSVMEKIGHLNLEFVGFMANEAGENWTAIYNGGHSNIFISREHSFLFHWGQSLQKHTKKYVLATFRAKHIEMCEQWRPAQSKEHANKQALAF